jgi:hypothetical protein
LIGTTAGDNLKKESKGHLWPWSQQYRLHGHHRHAADGRCDRIRTITTGGREYVTGRKRETLFNRTYNRARSPGLADNRSRSQIARHKSTAAVRCCRPVLALDKERIAAGTCHSGGFIDWRS